MTKFLAAMAALLLATGGALAQDKPNDAQIVHILTTANQLDIDGGKLAQSKGASKDVKAFGQQMVTDHTASQKSTADLAKKIKIKAQDNETSKKLKSDGEDEMKKLQDMSGKEFDKAYMDHEVKFHQTVLDSLDKTLIPNATNGELKSALTSTRSVIDAHLAQAKKVQGSLK